MDTISFRNANDAWCRCDLCNQANYWTDENPDPNADFPRMWPGNAGKGTVSVLDLGNHNFYPQSKYLVNMAYLRFQNLTIGYTLTKRLDT